MHKRTQARTTRPVVLALGSQAAHTAIHQYRHTALPGMRLQDGSWLQWLVYCVKDLILPSTNAFSERGAVVVWPWADASAAAIRASPAGLTSMQTSNKCLMFCIWWWRDMLWLRIFQGSGKRKAMVAGRRSCKCLHDMPNKQLTILLLLLL